MMLQDMKLVKRIIRMLPPVRAELVTYWLKNKGKKINNKADELGLELRYAHSELNLGLGQLETRYHRYYRLLAMDIMRPAVAFKAACHNAADQPTTTTT